MIFADQVPNFSWKQCLQFAYNRSVKVLAKVLCTVLLVGTFYAVCVLYSPFLTQSNMVDMSGEGTWSQLLVWEQLGSKLNW